MAEDRTTLREGRLKRWSRLKRGGGDDASEAPAEINDDEGYAAPDPHAMPGGAMARRGARVPAMASLVRDESEAADGIEAESESEAVGAPPDAEEIPVLTPEEEAVVRDLPPIDSLTKDSDFTPFLADKVPEFIRRRALAVLWRSDPVLANLDGLNDYDLNYRLIDTLIDAAKDTVYRAGKGYARDEEEVAEVDEVEAVEESAAAEAPEPAETTSEEQPEIDETDEEPAKSEAQANISEDADGAEPKTGELPKPVDSDSA